MAAVLKITENPQEVLSSFEYCQDAIISSDHSKENAIETVFCFCYDFERSTETLSGPRLAGQNRQSEKSVCTANFQI